MKIGNRTLALGAALAVAAGAVGGLAQGKAQLEFWTTSLNTFGDFFNPLVTSFQQANPSAALKWVDSPQNTIQQKALAAIAAGNPPDAIQLNSTQILELAQQGALLPLDGLLDAKTLALYQKNSLAAFTFDGKLYALPDYATTRIVAYNGDILRRAGVSLENLPKTMPGVLELAKTIKDKTGLYGFAPLIASNDFLKVFQEAGLPILDAKRAKAVFNSPEHVALLNEYVQLRKQDYFPEDVIRRGFTGAYELYAAGKLGIIIIGPTFMPRLEKDNNAVWKASIVAPHPVGLGNVVQASTFAYAVPKGVKDPKAAAMLAHHLTNDATQLAFSRRTGTTFPTTVKAAQDPFFTSLAAGTVNDRARLAAARTMKTGKELSVPVPNASTLNNAFKDNIEAALYGRKTPKQALDDAVKVWNANL